MNMSTSGAMRLRRADGKSVRTAATVWKPNIGILGSIIFGGLYIAASYINGIDLATKELFKILPYFVTVVVLIITSIKNKRENQPPAGLGANYFREDR